MASFSFQFVNSPLLADFGARPIAQVLEQAFEIRSLRGSRHEGQLEFRPRLGLCVALGSFVSDVVQLSDLADAHGVPALA